MPELPFLYEASVVDQGGSTVYASIPVSVWPATRQQSEAAGETFDHTGEAPITASQLHETANLSVVIAAGPMAGSYKIVGAVAQPLAFPHIGLELRRVRPGG